MKKFPLILLGFFAAGASHAATVVWGATSHTGLIDASAATLSLGNFVRIGYFGTLSDALVQLDAQTSAGIALLNSDFHEFANTTIGTNTGNTPATFSKSSNPLYSTLTTPSAFVPSSQIYFWALKSTNNSSLANALSTVTQTAIAYVPFANLATWRFPGDDISSTTIDLENLSNANRQVLAGNYVSGDSASLTPIFGAGNHALQLATVVPEPSTIVLGAIAALGAAGLRRRKRS